MIIQSEWALIPYQQIASLSNDFVDDLNNFMINHEIYTGLAWCQDEKKILDNFYSKEAQYDFISTARGYIC